MRVFEEQPLQKQAEQAARDLPGQIAHAREFVAEYGRLMAECRELESELAEDR